MPETTNNGQRIYATRESVEAIDSRLDSMEQELQAQRRELAEFRTEFLLFKTGLMGDSNFPGGAFGRLERALDSFSKGFVEIPSKIEQSVDARIDVAVSKKIDDRIDTRIAEDHLVRRDKVYRFSGAKFGTFLFQLAVYIVGAIIIALILKSTTSPSSSPTPTTTPTPIITSAPPVESPTRR